MLLLLAEASSLSSCRLLHANPPRRSCHGDRPASRCRSSNSVAAPSIASNGCVLAYTGVLLVSLAVGHGSIFYAVRLLEYFSFFYAAVAIGPNFRMSSFMWVWSIVNSLATTLQKLGIIGGFSSLGYVTGIDRPMGLTAGPWESGVVANSIMSVFFFSEDDSCHHDGWLSSGPPTLSHSFWVDRECRSLSTYC